MILEKPFTDKQYAEFAYICTKDDLDIKEYSDRLEALPRVYSDDEKKRSVRLLRKSLINDLKWRIERYQTQEAGNIKTNDSKETYVDMLLYLQYLRDYPEQKNKWWDQNPLTFDEWRKND